MPFTVMKMFMNIPITDMIITTLIMHTVMTTLIIPTDIHQQVVMNTPIR